MYFLARRTWGVIGVLAAAFSGLKPDLALAEIRSRGELGAETRYFQDTGSPETLSRNHSVVSRMQLDWAAEGETLDEVSVRVRLFARMDSRDQARRRIIPEEAYTSVEIEPVRFRFGYQIHSWSALETFHPVDVLNSRIIDGNIEEPEKIGELTASARIGIPGGNVELLFMPLFVEPVYPSYRSALRLSSGGLEVGNGVILDRDGRLSKEAVQPQIAIRVQQTLGDVDLSVHAVHHIDRQAPLFYLNSDNLHLTPVYQAVTQVGFAGSYIGDSFGLKAEGVYRRFGHSVNGLLSGDLVDRDHLLLAAGVEIGDSLGGGSETSFFLEGQALVPTEQRLPELLKPIFQRDAFLGARHAFNDDQSLVLSGGIVVDLQKFERIIGNASFQRRLGDVWILGGGVRVINYPPRDKNVPVLFENLHKKNHVYAEFLRYF